MTTGLRWPAEQPTLRAEDVVLRPWRPGDAEAVFRACQDLEIQRWTTVPSPYRLADAEWFVDIAAQLWDPAVGCAFAAVDEHDEVLLGSFGIVASDPGDARGEVGYWTSPWARRRGAAVAGLRQLTKWALQQVGYRSLEAVVDHGNDASIAVARKAGYSEPTDARPPLRVDGPDDAVVLVRTG